MTARKWRIKRPMLVPATWQGSVEHFYHFLMGYFVPLVRWQEKTGETTLSVRDCGPMNPWFALLHPTSDVEIMTPSWMLQRYLTRKQTYQVFHQWDDPRRFNRRALHQVAAVVLGRCVGTTTKDRGAVRITILERRPSPSYYMTGSSDAYASGAEWRSIPNLADAVEVLRDLGEVELVDTADMRPRDQVRLLSQTDVLIGQHGAGLSNLMWMTPGSAIVEIQPPLVSPIDQIFSSLASAMHMDYQVVQQDGDHSPVNPTRIRNALLEIQRSPRSFVPAMPGRQPLRALRQLPRRF